MFTHDMITQVETNPAAGLVSIFYSPVDTYTASGRTGWVIALIAAALIAAVGNWYIINRIGYANIVRAQLESNTAMAERMGPGGIEKAVADAENSRAGAVMGILGPALGIPIALFVLGGVTYGFLLALGGRTTYKVVVTASAWAMYAAITVMMAGSAAAVSVVSDASDLDLGRLFGLHAGLFISDSQPVLRAAASGVDLVAFWAMFLQTIGLTRLSEGVTRTQALTVLITIHLILTGFRMGWAALFS